MFLFSALPVFLLIKIRSPDFIVKGDGGGVNKERREGEGGGREGGEGEVQSENVIYIKTNNVGGPSPLPPPLDPCM